VNRVNGPPPASVPQRLWRDIEIPPLGELDARARVTVLVDGDGRAAALPDQTYPADLIEVLGPGDGDPQGDLVLVLPAGASPAPALVEAHARWHHAVADAVSLGPVAPEGGVDDALGLVRDLTRDLTDFAGGCHLAAADGTFAVRRDLFLDAGGAGEAPAGLRRLDLLYRLHAAGAVFVADTDARARNATGDLAPALARACEAGETMELELPAAAALVPLPPFREVASARRHARPALTVNLPVAASTPTEEALATIAGVLSGRLGDLELRVQVDPAHPAPDAIAGALGADPRAALAPSSLEGGCEAPFQVTLPPEAALDPRTLADLHELAVGEEAGALHVTVPGEAPQDAMIEVVATAAWRRARRLAAATAETEAQVIGDLFGERWMSGVEVSTRRHGIDEPQVTEHGPLAAATDLDHERNAHLRFRERAEDLAERAAALGQRTLAERLRAREERRAAERAEARLER
jgi:hypothetical protein